MCISLLQMTVCMRQMSEIHSEAFGNMQRTVDVSTKVIKDGGGWGWGKREGWVWMVGEVRG